MALEHFYLFQVTFAFVPFNQLFALAATKWGASLCMTVLGAVSAFSAIGQTIFSVGVTKVVPHYLFCL